MTRQSTIACGMVVAGALAAWMALTPSPKSKTLLAETGGERTRDGIQPTETADGSASTIPPAGASPAPVPTNAAKRGFLMGFTSWPYAATADAVQGTYAFIGTNADLVVEHMDDGVPWVESLREVPFPKAFLDKIEGRRKSRPPATKLLLSLTPLNMGRNALAESAGNGQRPPLPAELKDKPFNDPQLVRAYASYCRRMVEFFQPDFLLTGIEANELLNNQPKAWNAYRELSRQVQRGLREKFPQLPISESITLHKLLDRQNHGLVEYRKQIQVFVESHDFFAVSFYPFFLGLHQEQEFAEALDYLPMFTRRPIAITETGHPAEPLKIRAWNLDFPTNPKEQAAFVRVLLSRAQAHHYRFVTYWAARDFDELWKTFPDAVKDLGALWRDTGLIDQAGQPRPAYETWKGWLGKPRE